MSAIKILVVDDDAATRHMVAAALTRHGHRVMTAPDALRALALLTIAEIDALVLDVLMPELTGFELLRILRQNPRTRQIPVLFLSALGEPKDRARGIVLGADDYLPKPFDPDEIIARVERMAGHRSAPEGGFLSKLSKGGLIETLQSLEQNGRHGLVNLVSSRRHGWITVRGGELVEVEYGLLTGPEAIYAMLELDAGTVSFEPMPEEALEDKPVDRELNLPSLAIRMARLQDDLRQFEETLPEDNAPLYVTAEAGGEPPALQEIPCVEVYERIAALKGVTLAELLSHQLLSPIKTRLAVAVLIQRDWVKTVSREESGS